MKTILSMALLGAALLMGAAEVNLLGPKWNVYGKKNDKYATVIQKDGQIDCSSEISKGVTGVVQSLNFSKKPLTGEITFGAESKAENAVGYPAGNYCVYLDITYADGTRLFGRQAVFTKGTHDWEKKSTTIKLAKPVKTISYYVLFRNMTGKASFRAPFLYNKEVAK